MSPYKHYDAGLIEDVVDGVVSGADLETENYPCEGTINHWKWWMKMNEPNIEGQTVRLNGICKHHYYAYHKWE